MILNILILTLLISLGINVFFLILASFFKTDKFTDITYGMTFVILAWYLYFYNDINFGQLVLAILITLWGIRLGTYLLIRIFKIGKDSRFDDKRDKFVEFAKFWIFQGLAVWVISLPSILVLSSKVDINFNIFSVLGILIFLVGLIIEAISDFQKFNFKNNPKNHGKWIESGIWKYSRHPNYFGEMTLWWGIFIYCSNYFSGLEFLSIIGPMFITYILLFVSGIPLLEKRYEKKYKGNKDYENYKKRTSKVVVWFNKNM